MNDFLIRWRNFRSFTDTNWLHFKPLTVLIGSNNTGKTSLFAPLLLLKQTLDSKDQTIPLTTTGGIFNAGLYQDFIRDHDIYLMLTLDIRWLIPTDKKDDLEPVGKYPPSGITLEFGYDEEQRSIFLRQYKVYDIYGRNMITRKRNAKGNYSISKQLFSGDDDTTSKFARNLIKKGQPNNFYFTATSNFREFFDAEDKKQKSRDSDIEQFREVKIPGDLVVYLNVVDYVRHIVNSLLNNISYVGPLRERPRRIYELSEEQPFSVGIRGEFAPEILFRSKDRELNKKVNKWISLFEFGDRVMCHPLSQSVFEVQIHNSTTGAISNIADTGFGFSQILPIIVAGLNSNKDDTIIFEQPEIHLNPRLQTKLADLFVEFVNMDRNIVVETHSEHIVTRLRRLISDQTIDSNKVGLYFVEKTDFGSTVKEVPIQENGHIEPEKWPDGFFEEGLKQAMGLAASQSKRKKDAS